MKRGEVGMELQLKEMYRVAHDNIIPISMTIELLTQCNEKCEHCYIPEHNDCGMDTEQIISILRQFRKMGGLNVTFTGGEIFLRKDLLTLIEEARNLHMRVFLLTNATLINEQIAKKLKELHIAEVSVSIYSLDEKIHDDITKVRGSLKKTLQGIEAAKNNGISIMVKTPLMEKNKYAYREIAAYCEQNGFTFMTSPVIFSKSDGDTLPHQLAVNKADLKIVLDEIQGYQKSIAKENYEEACGALKYSFAIDCMGNFFPCNAFYYRIGNVKQNTLYELWRSKELEQVQNIKKSDLQECNECGFAQECVRCPGLAYLEDGNMLGCSSTAKAIAVARYIKRGEEG